MPKQSFPLEAGEEKRLEISWKVSWKLSWINVNITLDGNPIGVISDQKALSDGKEFLLPDNSVIKVKLIELPSYGLQVLRNGHPLPGSATDPQT